MPRPINPIDPAELADMLAIMDGARAHRSAEPDYMADALLLLRIMHERRITIPAGSSQSVASAMDGETPMSGLEIRAARDRHQISRPELARHAGLHVDTVRSFEHGAGKPTARTARALTAAIQALTRPGNGG